MNAWCVCTLAQGRLASLPLLLEGYTPDLGRLPGLVLALARDVDWEEETACFRGLAEVRTFTSAFLVFTSTFASTFPDFVACRISPATQITVTCNLWSVTVA